MNHDWWAVELRKMAQAMEALGAATRDSLDAIDKVLELLDEDVDCSECVDQWLDEAAGREVDDFPERLTEEHVIRIMALEDAVLVRHALDQWLIALDARRRRRIEEELAKARARGDLAASFVAVALDPPSARMRARSDQRG